MGYVIYSSLRLYIIIKTISPTLPSFTALCLVQVHFMIYRIYIFGDTSRISDGSVKTKDSALLRGSIHTIAMLSIFYINFPFIYFSQRSEMRKEVDPLLIIFQETEMPFLLSSFYAYLIDIYFLVAY